MNELTGELTLCFLGEVQSEKAIKLMTAHPELLDERFLGDTWLACAAKEGAQEVCEYLIGIGVDVNEKGEDFYALENAILGEHLELAETLLKSGADPNLGRTLVAANGKPTAVQFANLLIKHGVDVNQVFEMFGDSDKCQTALDWSTEDSEFAKTLRQAGALTFAELK